MNRNKVTIANLLMTAILAITLVGCSGKGQYYGTGIPYITVNKNKTNLTICSSEGIYKEKIGSKEDIFWLASCVYENEAISVDNKDTIYRFTDEKIERFSDIKQNIVAALKISDKYLIISESDNKVYVSLYKKDFTSKIDEKSVEGSFEHCYVENDMLYYSIWGSDRNFTSAYAYSITNHTNEQVYYNNQEEDVYPFTYNGALYLAKNTLIQETGNKDIFELHKKQEDGEFVKIMDLEEYVIKILVSNKEIYAIEGKNTSYLSIINLSENKHEMLFSFDNEAAFGLYSFENKVHVLTSQGIYSVEDGQLLKQHDLHAIELMNVFY